MKTTIDISDELLLRAKRAALERGTTLRALVEEALERTLGSASAEPEPLRTVTWGSARSRRSGKLDTKGVDALVAHERDGVLGNPEYWTRRFGFVPPSLRKK